MRTDDRMYHGLSTRHTLDDFQKNPLSICMRLKKNGAAEVLMVGEKVGLIMVAPRSFLKLLKEYEALSISQSICESALESLRIGELSPKELKPNPRARGIPMKEAFARIKRNITRRKIKAKR